MLIRLPLATSELGELPNTGSDKVQHAEVRRIALERLAAEASEAAAV